MIPTTKNPKDVVFWNAFCQSPKDGHTPSVIYRTIGPYKLAHALRSNNITAQVIDFVTLLSEDELFELSIKFIDNTTTCLALSTTYILDSISNFGFDPKLVAVINRILKEYPNLNLVFGGYGIGALKQDLHLLNKRQVIFVSQYGEDVIPSLVQYLMGTGKRPRFEIESDPTMSTTIHIYSTPAVSTYNIQTDNFRFTKEDCIQPNETLPIEISRGCIFKCKFCNHLLLGRGKLDYLRDFELVRQEMMNNYQKWGTTNYYIICDTFNDTEYKMQAWHKMIMSLPFKIRFTAYLRADLLDRFPDTPYMLKESGLTSAYHGIESLGEQASNTIGKGWSGKSAKDYIPRLYHDIWNKEVYQTISLIAGLPGDTREILLDTAHWFRDNDLYNVVWHTLGLATNQTAKNASEFERDSAKYGYELNNNAQSETDWKWQTSYWNNKQAGKYLRETLLPIVEPVSAKYSSWGILQLLQYNIPVDSFKKEKLKSIYSVRLKTSSANWMKKYTNAIKML
jgi:radical SAM superfamily enzyme YgiQ (UPF0313 family)